MTLRHRSSSAIARPSTPTTPPTPSPRLTRSSTLSSPGRAPRLSATCRYRLLGRALRPHHRRSLRQLWQRRYLHTAVFTEYEHAPLGPIITAARNVAVLDAPTQLRRRHWLLHLAPPRSRRRYRGRRRPRPSRRRQDRRQGPRPR